jgi:hypothetical protein
MICSICECPLNEPHNCLNALMNIKKKCQWHDCKRKVVSKAEFKTGKEIYGKDKDEVLMEAYYDRGNYCKIHNWDADVVSRGCHKEDLLVNLFE